MTVRKSRTVILEKDLLNYNPKMWSINLPGTAYNLRIEDFVPALAGSIGKVALAGAFALAWSKGFNITDPTFVTENVRLEIFIGSILTIIFCSILNPYSAPPGTLAPLIPIIPLMASSGVHPLILAVLISFIGIIITVFNYFDVITSINGTAAKGGIILLFGIMGITSSMENLKVWSYSQNKFMFSILLITALVIYLILSRFGYKWLVIPAVSVVALVIAAMFNIHPHITTKAAFPLLNPFVWWHEKWSIGFGLTLSNFIKALPFAILAIVMWPTDALAIKTLQEAYYPENARKSVFNTANTYLIVSIRNIIGTFLGGAQTAAIWRSFMIPLSIVKRPIGGSSLILGITGIAFGLLGFPLDIAVFAPLIWLVLIFGVFIPLIEIGLSTIKSVVQAQIAGLCILIGLSLNPVLGWITAILIENLKILNDHPKDRSLNKRKVIPTVIITIVTISSYVLSFII